MMSPIYVYIYIYIHTYMCVYIYTNICIYIYIQTHIYRGADMSLARPTSRCILFDGENISFDASLVLYIYIFLFIYSLLHGVSKCISWNNNQCF